MNEIESGLKNYIHGDINWDEEVSLRNRSKGSQVSVSSVSSNLSDSSNSEYAAKLERKSSLQEIINKEDNSSLAEYKRSRSNSDGGAGKWGNQDPEFEVFPSLPNSVLEKLGLRGNSSRERLSDDELEQKFSSLALAFTIDATTIKDRCERQRRSRDQTEENLSKEIEKFKEKLICMQPLCTDYEKAELFSILMTQIDVIEKATSLVSISAEKYGSVQHEERLTESVGLMVNHVQILKQQRDSARRQFQLAKRVLQDSSDSSPSPIHSPRSSLANRRILTERRASFTTLMTENNKTYSDVKKITRRPSDLPLRAASLLRNTRPTRLELGVELVKIKEGYVEQHLSESVPKSTEIESKTELNSRNSCTPDLEEVTYFTDSSKSTFRKRLQRKVLSVKLSVEERFKKWADGGSLHETCQMCAFLCFAFGFIFLADIFLEIESAKRGQGGSILF